LFPGLVFPKVPSNAIICNQMIYNLCPLRVHSSFFLFNFFVSTTMFLKYLL
jgi:hypothetical protein